MDCIRFQRRSRRALQSSRRRRRPTQEALVCKDGVTPAQPEIALRIGPIRSRSSAGVVEPDHWKHPAGLAWWYRDVPSMCASISPPYHTSSAGDFSRTDGSLNARISSQIALFPKLLILGRQPTAVGFKIPAPRVAIYDLPHGPEIFTKLRFSRS